jgi:hypothetical protein
LTVVTVTAKDGTEPVTGGVVTYKGPTTGASLANPITAKIASDGEASLTATANTTAGGPYTVNASASGAPSSASFSLTNTPDKPASITVVSGSGQSTQVAKSFGTTLVVVVKDQYQNLVSGATVTYTAPSSGASATLTGSPATTGSNGQASVTAMANTKTGGYTVTAAVAGVNTPASFSLTNLVGDPASIAVVSGSGQSATAGTSFAQPLVVVVMDQYQNLVPGVTVSFAVPNSGASAILMGSPATTGSNGQASVTATANTIPGSYTVTASTAGVTPSAMFSLDNLYAIVPTFDQTKVHTGGSTIPITIQVTNQGKNIGSSSLSVTAVSVIGPSGPVPLQSPGNSQPGNLFTFDPCASTYQFNLKTTGYAPGKYTLMFKIGHDPALYSVTFLVG